MHTSGRCGGHGLVDDESDGESGASEQAVALLGNWRTLSSADPTNETHQPFSILPGRASRKLHLLKREFDLRIFESDGRDRGG
jgi:hypothetical protein